MAAGLGFKDFVTGEVLTAADVDGYLMQGVWVFASAAARDAAVTSPQEGNFAYLKDTNVTTYYTGSAWANLDTTGMTNPMTTTGDTIYSSSGSTPARLGIGSTGQVLTVAAGIPSWATPSSGTPSFVGCFLAQTANQSISTATETIITFDAEEIDTDGFHSNVTNTGRITIPSGKAGKYLIITKLLWQAITTNKWGYLYKNNVNVEPAETSNNFNVAFNVQNHYVLDLAVGDYIDFRVYHEGGSSVNIGKKVFGAIYLGA